MITFFLAVVLLGTVPLWPPAPMEAQARAGASAPACEDFANRQTTLADQALEEANYTRALKILNRTIENCDQDFVREKLLEVFNAWFRTVRIRKSTASTQRFLNVVNAQPNLSSAQKSQFEGRTRSMVRSLIQDETQDEAYSVALQFCRSFSDYVDGHFETVYHCGLSAIETDANDDAIAYHEDLLENWTSNQSLLQWSELANTLEELYFLEGRFEQAYDLARQKAVRDPSPEAVLSSLVSLRGDLLSPILRAGIQFYGRQPPNGALTHVDDEMRRVKFPKYVRAFYLLREDGTVERGMYGTGANAPDTSQLKQATSSLSLLQSTEDQNLGWLVSPVEDRFLVLEFGAATTAEVNVRLEKVYNNIDSEEQWEKLQRLEFSEGIPATGSAVGTILSGAELARQDINVFDALFDDSSLLTYYCIQDDSGAISESFNFNRNRLAYGDEKWQRTTNTPALYHHVIEYGDQSVREVVWPKFIDETWTGVVRIGLARR